MKPVETYLSNIYEPAMEDAEILASLGMLAGATVAIGIKLLYEKLHKKANEKRIAAGKAPKLNKREREEKVWEDAYKAQRAAEREKEKQMRLEQQKQTIKYFKEWYGITLTPAPIGRFKSEELLMQSVNSDCKRQLQVLKNNKTYLEELGKYLKKLQSDPEHGKEYANMTISSLLNHVKFVESMNVSHGEDCFSYAITLTDVTNMTWEADVIESFGVDIANAIDVVYANYGEAYMKDLAQGWFYFSGSRDVFNGDAGK